MPGSGTELMSMRKLSSATPLSTSMTAIMSWSPSVAPAARRGSVAKVSLASAKEPLGADVTVSLACVGAERAGQPGF